MFRTALHALLGLGLVGGATAADLRGWLGQRPAIVRDVPRTVRDNPGSYRAIYSGYPHYFGGK